MKISLAIGGVEVTLSGLDLTPRQVRDLMRSAASIALALPAEPQPAPEPDTRAPLGFTAHIDLDSERNYADDTSEWYEEDRRP